MVRGPEGGRPGGRRSALGPLLRADDPAGPCDAPRRAGTWRPPTRKTRRSSAFESFRAGAEQGQFPDVGDREDLWRLLAVITVRKAQAQARRHRRLKRGGGLSSARPTWPRAAPMTTVRSTASSPGA